MNITGAEEATVKLFIALGVAVLGCQTSDPSPVPVPADDDGVTLSAEGAERLSGSYVDPASGVGLVFDAAKAGDELYLHLTTSNGVELVHVETLADGYVFRYLGGRLTLTVDKAWVAAVRAEGDDGPAAADESAAKWTGDRAVLDEMLQLPEMAALPFLSRSLGVRGITGASHPASLVLHKMARQSSEALDIQLPPLETAAGNRCSRPTANECYGMCGNGCSCWSWVCGDCCYHSGCAKHDSWCRNGQWYYCYNITAVVALFGC